MARTAFTVVVAAAVAAAAVLGAPVSVPAANDVVEGPSIQSILELPTAWGKPAHGSEKEDEEDEEDKEG